MPESLAAVAPRLAAARDAFERHYRRNIKRCSCGLGWRVVGHEYDTGGCMDFEQAVLARDAFERREGGGEDA